MKTLNQAGLRSDTVHAHRLTFLDVYRSAVFGVNCDMAALRSSTKPCSDCITLPVL